MRLLFVSNIYCIESNDYDTFKSSLRTLLQSLCARASSCNSRGGCGGPPSYSYGGGWWIRPSHSCVRFGNAPGECKYLHRGGVT